MVRQVEGGYRGVGYAGVSGENEVQGVSSFVSGGCGGEVQVE